MSAVRNLVFVSVLRMCASVRIYAFPYVQWAEPGHATINTSTTTAVKFLNYGGSIIPSITVQPIYYNSAVQFQPQISAYYKALVGSPVIGASNKFIAFLASEYNTPTQKITTGRTNAPFTASGTAVAMTYSVLTAFLSGLF